MEARMSSEDMKRWGLNEDQVGYAEEELALEDEEDAENAAAGHDYMNNHEGEANEP